ncbi:DNA repair nucleotidyltransferase [Lujinxingia litoralis]|uniref:DNA repair nucleotidyltransferase n=1 Tax=Lujinxingia litoralis TaxID=2211119 RepID=A0A328CC33_9DELT|nr:DNA polymerase Y family protein [Lujinxingia litoralis]RAL23717.1 DNA repair nucleotidyltransferase [Lujinxingia litoralis]
MDRWACVNAADFPLQVLLRSHPDWRQGPAALLDRDHPQGRLVGLNASARQAGLSRGMHYGEALALIPALRAGTVDPDQVASLADTLAQALGEYSPQVERHQELPGLFWLNASGLGRLYPDWRQWAGPLRRRIFERFDIRVTLAVGFRRALTYVIARTADTSGAFDTPEAERRAAGQARLTALDLPRADRELLTHLGLHTLDDLLALPAQGLHRRLSPALVELYRQARGDRELPIEPFTLKAPAQVDHHLDYAERNTHRLLFLLKGHLHPLLRSLEETHDKLVALNLHFELDHHPALSERIEPAEPTLDALTISDLIWLRLESLELPAGVTHLTLVAHGERTCTEQLRLDLGGAARSTRDIEAANRALARLRAHFGTEVVQRVRLRQAHLPEGRFVLEPLPRIPLPSPPSAPHPQAVRRFYPSPQRLRSLPGVSTRQGPHTICGGWWVREIHRDYHLMVTEDERLIWTFYDHRRHRWYVHAEF